MGIGGDEFHRQIGYRENPDQHQKRKRRQAALQNRRRAGQSGDSRLASCPHGQDARDELQGGQRGSQPKRGKAEFGDHSKPTVVSSAIFAACIWLMPSSSRGT